MLESYLRPRYQSLLVDPLANCLLRFRDVITPNMLTALSLSSGLLVFFALWLDHIALAVGLLLLSGYLDTMDGTLARLQDNSTAFGTAFDIVADRIVEFAIICGLYVYDPYSRAALCILMLGSILICVTSFLIVGVFSESDGKKSFYYSPGIIERPEAFCFFASMIIFPHAFLPLACLFSVLVLLTSGIRMWQFRQSSQ